MVRRGLALSRAEAARAIDSNMVLVNGSIADKSSRLVDPADAVVLQGPRSRFVSRGGDKLDAALDGFGIDVGHGQLHPKIRDDQRVTVHERFHVRDLGPAAIGGAVDMVVADLSFISIIRALPSLIAVCHPHSELVLLVKPQFEAGKAEVDRGSGVIRDPAVHQRVCDEVSAALTARSCDVLGWIDSPITGAQGNREFLVHARLGRSGSEP